MQGQQRRGERHVDAAPQPGFNLPQFDPEPCDGFCRFCHHKMPGAVSGRVLVRRQSRRRTKFGSWRRVAALSRRSPLGADAAWRRRSGRDRRAAARRHRGRHGASLLRLFLLRLGLDDGGVEGLDVVKCAALCSCRLRWLPWGDQALECRPSRRARRWWVVDSHRRASGAGGPGVRPGTRAEDPISTCPRGSLLRVAATSLWGRFPTFRTLARGLLLGAHGSPLFGDLYS